MVLLLHGWATTSSVWQPVLDRWNGDERLLALDLRGVGFSDKPERGYTVEDYAGDVVEVLRHVDEPVALVGHSLGGMIAQRVAVARPANLVRLVLVAPVPASGVPVPAAQRAQLRTLVGRREGMATVLSSMMAGGACHGFERLLEASASVSAAAYLEGLDTFCDTDFAMRLAELALPVHVIGGALDEPLNPALLQAAVVQRITGATWQVLDGVGHYPQWEAPDVLTRELAHALRGNAGR